MDYNINMMSSFKDGTLIASKAKYIILQNQKEVIGKNSIGVKATDDQNNPRFIKTLPIHILLSPTRTIDTIKTLSDQPMLINAIIPLDYTVISNYLYIIEPCYSSYNFEKVAKEIKDESSAIEILRQVVYAIKELRDLKYYFPRGFANEDVFFSKGEKNEWYAHIHYPLISDERVCQTNISANMDESILNSIGHYYINLIQQSAATPLRNNIGGISFNSKIVVSQFSHDLISFCIFPGQTLDELYKILDIASLWSDTYTKLSPSKFKKEGPPIRRIEIQYNCFSG